MLAEPFKADLYTRTIHAPNGVLPQPEIFAVRLDGGNYMLAQPGYLDKNILCFSSDAPDNLQPPFVAIRIKLAAPLEITCAWWQSIGKQSGLPSDYEGVLRVKLCNPRDA